MEHHRHYESLEEVNAVIKKFEKPDIDSRKNHPEYRARPINENL